MCYSFLPEDSEEFFAKIDELLQIKDLKSEFAVRKEKMMTDKIDVTAFYVWFFENYPLSAGIVRKNPEYMDSFR